MEDDKKIINKYPVKSPFLDTIFIATTFKANA